MNTYRKTAFRLLDPDQKSDWLARFLDLFLIALIAINVAAVILETVESIDARFHAAFWVIEVISMAIFSLEYLARVWTSVEDPKYQDHPNPRLSYMKSPMAVIDLMAILPFYLGFFFKLDLRFLRVVRLLRFLKLTRYSSAMTVLLDVFKEEANAFFAGFFILIVLLILAASGAYLVEHEVQPEKFGSIPAAMWWAMATLTTVGYGDVAPVTPAGQVFGSLVAVVGIGMAALPAGILASGLADRLHHSREELADKLRAVLDDDEVDTEDEEVFEKVRRDLGLSKRVAQTIRRNVQNSRKEASMCFCPHCGESLQQER
ncbi:ion transporter [uncultured Litoreibacter sp.]|uniref:ion transporter n=1 Tax=uncultured Litoreibacter sp. TaxID=1392394 RepID=UPI0026258425|nr:ion transporter [uncultured Litoreibacter sp.]